MLSLKLKSLPDRVFTSILRGRCGTVKLLYHPVLDFNKLLGGKPDQNHVCKRILGGKGLQYEDSEKNNLCLASALDFEPIRRSCRGSMTAAVSSP